MVFDAFSIDGSRHQPLQWAGRRRYTFHFDVQINHRRGNVGVAHEFLNGSQVSALLKQMRCKTMPQGVRSNSLQDLRPVCGSLYLAADIRFVHVMPADATGVRTVAQR